MFVAGKDKPRSSKTHACSEDTCIVLSTPFQRGVSFEDVAHDMTVDSLMHVLHS